MDLFGLEAKEREKEINNAFFSVFSTEAGRTVLAVLLEETGYLDKQVTHEDAVLRNFMNGILYRIGTIQPDRLDSLGVAEKLVELAMVHRRA
jgi:aminoglycoside phosphotransferase